MDVNQTNGILEIYLQITTKFNVTYNYQNFSVPPVSWNNKTWQYVPIKITVPSNSMDLDNISVPAIIPNTPETLQALKDNDGFRDAIVLLFLVLNSSLTYVETIMSVRNSKVSGAYIEFTLQSPFNAVSAVFPSVYYTTGRSSQALNIVGYVPEVPLVSRVSLQ